MSIDGLCRSCGSRSLTSILDLGLQPFAGDYPDPADPAPEARWPLRTAVCSSCRLIQLVGDVPMEPQEPGTAPAAQSSTMRDHARRFAAEVAGLPNPGVEPIVEVASHGGYLHEYLAELGVDSIVAERSPSLIADLRRRGVPVRDTGLSHQTAGRIQAGREGSPVVVDNYLLAHVPDPNDLVAGMREALAPGGHLVLEFDHALTIVADGQFDAFRHGHFTYWSLYALDRLLQRHGLIAVDVTEQPVYGGALRVVARRTDDALAQGPAISRVLDAEHLAGLDRPETYTSFAGSRDRGARTRSKVPGRRARCGSAGRWLWRSDTRRDSPECRGRDVRPSAVHRRPRVVEARTPDAGQPDPDRFTGTSPGRSGRCRAHPDLGHQRRGHRPAVRPPRARSPLRDPHPDAWRSLPERRPGGLAQGPTVPVGCSSRWSWSPFREDATRGSTDPTSSNPGMFAPLGRRLHPKRPELIAGVQHKARLVEPPSLQRGLDDVDQREVPATFRIGGCRMDDPPIVQPDRRHEWVDVLDVGPSREKFVDDVERRRFADILDARLVRDTDDEDSSTSNAPTGVRKHRRRPVDHLQRARRDVRHRLFDHGRREAARAQLPQEIVGIARDAMTTDAGAWSKGHEPKGLGRCGVDDLGDVELQLDADPSRSRWPARC